MKKLMPSLLPDFDLIFSRSVAAVLWGCFAFGPVSAVAGDVPVETASVAVLPPNQDSMVYLPDITAAHLIDSRVHIVDGETMGYLGSIPSGLDGFFALGPARNEIYVAATYLSRGTRGTRADVIDVYDSSTLALKREIELPPKRAQAVAYSAYFRSSTDGALLFVQNITPASSVSIVSAMEGRFLAEMETAGCAGIYPSPTTAGRFSSICGDGTALTITVDNAGGELLRHRSEQLFDPVRDPIFIADARSSNGAIFVSYNGMIHQVDFTGPVAKQVELWSVLTPDDRAAAWRPGGYDLMAFHRLSGQLYIAMHAQGREGSHKNPADEIWQIDIATRKQVARFPAQHTIALGVTQGEKPLLFALDAISGALVKYDASGSLRRVASLEPPLVEVPLTMMMP